MRKCWSVWKFCVRFWKLLEFWKLMIWILGLFLFFGFKGWCMFVLEVVRVRDVNIFWKLFKVRDGIK